VKRKRKSSKFKNYTKSIFTQLKTHSHSILVGVLTSTGVLLGTLGYLKRPQPIPPQNDVATIVNPARSLNSITAKSYPTITFPQSQLPPDFKSPVPSLISSSSGINIIPHQSILARKPLHASDRLDKVIDSVIKEVTNKTLKKEALSISVIDVNHGEIAGYQADRMEYPASIVKLFWAVAIYEQIDRKIWKNPETFDALAKKMLVESDNEAASFIVDSISGAPSIQKNLEGKEWESWRSRRLSINQFFIQGGYKDLNVAQKTYPIPYLNLNEPIGTDKQLRFDGTTSDKPIRNKISAEQAATLMYETCAAIESPKQICTWISRNIKDPSWRKAPGVPQNDFNPIRGFMGEGVASHKDVNVRSKAGWTKDSRQEVIAIKNSNGKVLIISVFANHNAYAKDATIFPKISGLLYKLLIDKN
jgi:beta-lactamase class A